MQTDRERDRYVVTLRIAPITGLCYAPQSILLNGFLSLDGLDRVDSWAVVPAGPEQVEGLDGILSAKRVKIDADGVKLSIPKDMVFKRPFNAQFVVFPCDSPTKSTTRIRPQIVSIAAYLPTFDGRASDKAGASRP